MRRARALKVLVCQKYNYEGEEASGNGNSNNYKESQGAAKIQLSRLCSRRGLSGLSLFPPFLPPFRPWILEASNHEAADLDDRQIIG